IVGGLNGGSISNGVRERHTEFESVSARCNDRADDVEAIFGARVIEHDERHKGTFILVFSSREELRKACSSITGSRHNYFFSLLVMVSMMSLLMTKSGLSVKVRRTWSMSLSPRPESETKISMSSSFRLRA